MGRSQTQENLAILSQRNKGNRRSLVFDDEYVAESDNSQLIDPELEQADKPEKEQLKTTEPKFLADEKDEGRSSSKNKKDAKDLYRDYFLHIHGKTGFRLRRRKAKNVESDSVLNHPEFRSLFEDIDYYTIPTTIFDSESFKKSDFFGLYVLFWLGTAFLMVDSLVRFYHESSIGLLETPVIRMLRKDVIKIGMIDLAMYLTMYVTYFIQKAILKGYITWEREGWILQSIYQMLHLWFWLFVASPHYMNFTWSGRVFLVLHGLVMLMKMHSYAFYNGYMWQIFNELHLSQKYLDRLHHKDLTVPKDKDAEKIELMLLQSVRFCKFELDFQAKSNVPKLATVSENDSENNLAVSQKPTSFPNNITLFNFFEFTMFPTLVYAMNLPRTKRIRWSYVFEKTCGVFGIIFLMAYVAQNWMYPIVQTAVSCRELPTSEKVREYPFILLDMIPPFLMEYIFTFLLIWDSILNVIAELSRYADRDFYGPWWSCTDWSEYARIWNRPVHKFLLRHVYHSSLSVLKLSKSQAMLMTFMLSSIVHELVMYVIFRSLRGYLLLLQMSQIPLVMLSHTKYLRNKRVLGNVICWFGFISGPSMICTLYLMF